MKSGKTDYVAKPSAVSARVSYLLLRQRTTPPAGAGTRLPELGRLATTASRWLKTATAWSAAPTKNSRHANIKPSALLRIRYQAKHANCKQRLSTYSY
jgi:hypothetical protein